MSFLPPRGSVATGVAPASHANPGAALPVLGVLVLAIAVLVAGCAGRNPGKIEDPLKLKRISFDMRIGANDNQPARVDLLRVRDARKADELLRLETDAWFGEDGKAFLLANPKTVHDRWELVPGETFGPFKVGRRGKFAGILFCDSGGATRPMRLERDGDITVVVSDEGCTFAEAPRKESWRQRGRRSLRAELSFEMPPEANRNRPIQVELVRMHREELVEELRRHSGAAWFGGIAHAYRADHPEAIYDTWELVPGATYGPFRLAVNRSVAGVLYCGRSQEKPLMLPWAKRVEVLVEEDGCRLHSRSRESSRPWWNPFARGNR